MSLLDTNILLNSVISQGSKGAIQMTADIKHYYLNNPDSLYPLLRKLLINRGTLMLDHPSITDPYEHVLIIIATTQGQNITTS